MKKLWYEILINILALIAVVLAIMDLMDKIPPDYYGKYIILDMIILIIFAVDYFYRLLKAESKKIFFKQNIFDLLAIIPFSSMFRAFRIVRLFKILKLLKVAAFMGRFICNYHYCGVWRYFPGKQFRKGFSRSANVNRHRVYQHVNRHYCNVLY